jgi:uncharacterized membrane protein
LENAQIAAMFMAMGLCGELLYHLTSRLNAILDRLDDLLDRDR